MHVRQLRRLLGSGTVLLIASTLAAACNSGSGTSQKPSGAGNTVTGAESPAPTNALGQGTIANTLAEKIKGTK